VWRGTARFGNAGYVAGEKMRRASQGGDAGCTRLSTMKSAASIRHSGELGLVCLRITALLLSIAASTAVFARDPTAPALTIPPAVGVVGQMPLHWIQRDRSQELQHRVVVAGKLPLHLRWLSSALWMESARPGLSLDMNPNDATLIFRYRIKF